jgi:hypothetical protein
VTVKFTSHSYWQDIVIEDWVRCVRFSLPVSKDRLFENHVSVEELTRGEWRFELLLSVRFCGAGLVCGAVIMKGKIVDMTVEEEREVQWREALVGELGLDEEESKEEQTE